MSAAVEVPRQAAPGAAVDLLRDHPLKRATWWDGWTHGYGHGVTDGRTQEAQETAEAWRPVARHVKGLGSPQEASEAVLRARRAEVDRSDVGWRCNSRTELVATCLADWDES